MRVLCAILMLAMASLPSNAGTITISITSGPVNGSKSYTISDADVSTFIAWAQNQYATASTAQALVAWTNAWMQYTTNIIQQKNTVTTVPTPVSIQ